MTAIYLAPHLLTGSSHLLGTAGQAYCPTHGVAPDRVYIIKPMSPWAGCALTAPFHPYSSTQASYPSPRRKRQVFRHFAVSPLPMDWMGPSGISLLHLSWGHPRRALPVILALWSPDFPHAQAFALCPRLLGFLAQVFYLFKARLSTAIGVEFLLESEYNI